MQGRLTGSPQVGVRRSLDLDPASSGLTFFWPPAASCFQRGGGVEEKPLLALLVSKYFSQRSSFAALGVDESHTNGSNLFYTKQSSVMMGRSSEGRWVSLRTEE